MHWFLGVEPTCIMRVSIYLIVPITNLIVPITNLVVPMTTFEFSISSQNFKTWGDGGIEPPTSCTRSRNHTTRPITLILEIVIVMKVFTIFQLTSWMFQLFIRIHLYVIRICSLVIPIPD